MPAYASNVQIPNLPVGISLNGEEQLEAVQAGTSVRITSQQIANLAATISSAPTVTTAQKDALSVSRGALVFDTTLDKLCVYTGSAWETITSV
jgi:cytochrome c553